MQVVKIKVINNGDNELPAYATEESKRNGWFRTFGS